ncbi:type VII secretion target [Plantactinospora sp. GCM10030261]|uniref:type VII secretion target n=1 Tax=Plantactinospora sp. GCM10030261 TaxID=3273420 RepID=UPI00360A26A9
MAEAFNVDVAQVHRHAAKVLAVRDQIEAVKVASRAIAQNDAAYGLLCGWIAGILEARHQRQDALYAQVEENLSRAAEALKAAAQQFESTDDSSSVDIRQAGRVR